MRISDWSSDVCSSDLSTQNVRIRGEARPLLCFMQQTTRHNYVPCLCSLLLGTSGRTKSLLASTLGRRSEGVQPVILIVDAARGQCFHAEGAVQDRKSVESGEGVSGRVDHGGRR